MDLVKQLKFLPRLPYTQIAPVICTDQISYALLRRGGQTQRDSVTEGLYYYYLMGFFCKLFFLLKKTNYSTMNIVMDIFIWSAVSCKVEIDLGSLMHTKVRGILHLQKDQRQSTDMPHCTWLPEHSEAMSVIDSVCSSRTSDKVILLPLLGTSNTRIDPEETPRYEEGDEYVCIVLTCFFYMWTVTVKKYISLSTYPHKYNSPKLLISLGQTQPYLGTQTNAVSALDLM